jgi:galactan endo-beta-1,3-galactanase
VARSGLRLILVMSAWLMMAAIALVALAGPARASTWETLINGSFASYSTLESEWAYQYPWGSDHNGSARMYGSPTDHNHVFPDGSGGLTLKATRITWDEGNSSSSPFLPIRC